MRGMFKALVLAVVLAIVSFSAAVCAADVSLGVSIRTLSSPYQANYAAGGEIFCKEKDLPVVILSCEGSSEKQVNDIKALVARTQGNIVFMIDPNEQTDAFPIARALEESGVYFSTWWNKPDDVKVWDFPHWVSHMSYDGIGAGRFMGEELFAAFKTPYKGKFIGLGGMLANNAARDRYQGLEEAMAKYPGVELVAFETANWDRTQAYEKTKSMLIANPDIDGIWAANDDMALGALEALRERGLVGKVAVTGADGVDEVFEAIKKGEITATIFNDSKYQTIISLAHALAAKEGKLNVADLPHDRRQFFVSAINVNQKNFAEFEEKYIKNTPEYDSADFFARWVRGME
jgi:ribose transport system substrate-binding protein